MAIGAQVSMAVINNQAAQLCARWKHLSDATLEFTGPIATLGTSGLQALTPGFTSGDATAMVAAAVNLATLAGAYYGTTAITPAVNFDTALLPLRGTGPG